MRSGPVAMVAHTYYEEDPRVRREAETLVENGIPVEVFALRRPGERRSEVIRGVTVRRLNVRRHQGARLGVYMVEYLTFLARATVALLRADRRKGYRLVQVHTLPDFLVAAALPLRLQGVPVILDLHEAMPEFFRARFAGRAGTMALTVLRLVERASIGLADTAVTVNEALRDRLLDIGVPSGKVGLVPNAPRLALFDPTLFPPRAFMEDGVLRLVYTGALSPIYELDVVLRAVALLRERHPDLDVRLDLYGRDFAEVPLADLANHLGIGDRVGFHGRLPLDEMPGVVAAADIGVAPTRRSPFTDFSLSTKIYEYAAMHRPIVATRLPMVERTFGGGVTLYESGNADELATAVYGLVTDHGLRDQLVDAAGSRVRERAWEAESAKYVALVHRLTGEGPAAGS